MVEHISMCQHRINQWLHKTVKRAQISSCAPSVALWCHCFEYKKTLFRTRYCPPQQFNCIIHPTRQKHHTRRTGGCCYTSYKKSTNIGLYSIYVAHLHNSFNTSFCTL
ncbi:hypothetical protein [Bufonid herpesvirus 1]|uniref:hypothetical protein n=1 Tax=Bufonid herpesvirus 1 TaxID=2282206 RepID=UPI000EB6643D|nr:hypothetical protein [Bufonid herpesvirus 1]AXF48573.1 hypothetical protein [Bufonid herpesvirus 1]